MSEAWIAEPIPAATYVISRRRVVTSSPWMLSVRETGSRDYIIGIYRTRGAALQVARLLAGRERNIVEEK